jgi:hypothetical protein
MALTTDQQAQIDVQTAIQNAQHANQMALQAKLSKLDAVRMAKETLIENARSKAVDARDVSAADITTFAEVLNTYINS